MNQKTYVEFKCGNLWVKTINLTVEDAEFVEADLHGKNIAARIVIKTENLRYYERKTK